MPCYVMWSYRIILYRITSYHIISHHITSTSHHTTPHHTILYLIFSYVTSCHNLCILQWCHNWRDSVSNHQPHDCFLSRLFRRRSKKTSKLRVTGRCSGNSPATGEFPAQMASNAENVSIWWRRHDNWDVPVGRLAITWTNAGFRIVHIFLMNQFQWFLIKRNQLLYENINLEESSSKWRSFCLFLNAPSGWRKPMTGNYAGSCLDVRALPLVHLGPATIYSGPR